MNMVKMKQLYPDMLTGDGIMKDISSLDVPWADLITDGLINQTDLDIGYYSVSANKLASPFILDISNNNDFDSSVTPITSEVRAKIAGVIYSLFYRKWEHFWNIYTAEYNPINNYDMVETESVETSTSDIIANTGTVTTVTDKDVRDTGTVTDVYDDDKTQTGTISDSGSSSSADNLFGFNSSTAVGHDTNSETIDNTRTGNIASTDDSTNTKTNNLTHTDDTTDTETRNLYNNASGSREVSKEINRSGNIGVTTTQRMIESELEVWKWSFFKSIFDDIDSVCCLDIY